MVSYVYAHFGIFSTAGQMTVAQLPLVAIIMMLVTKKPGN